MQCRLVVFKNMNVNDSEAGFWNKDKTQVFVKNQIKLEGGPIFSIISCGMMIFFRQRKRLIKSRWSTRQLSLQTGANYLPL